MHHAKPFTFNAIRPPETLQDTGMLNNSDSISGRVNRTQMQFWWGQSLSWSTSSQSDHQRITLRREGQRRGHLGSRNKPVTSQPGDVVSWPQEGETATSSHLTHASNYRLKINKMSQSSPFIVPWKSQRLLPSVLLLLFQRRLLIYCILNRLLQPLLFHRSCRDGWGFEMLVQNWFYHLHRNRFQLAYIQVRKELFFSLLALTSWSLLY